MKTKIFPIFTLLLLTVSCSNDELQTLVLHTPQQIDNTIVLNWEQASISDFEYYIVMRSSDQNRYEIINDIVTPTSNAFRKEITTFEDRTYPLGIDSLYYKIMAVGKTTQSSQGLCYRIEHPVRLIKGNVQDVHFVEETNKVIVLLFEYTTEFRSILKIFDLETGQFSSKEARVNMSNTACWHLWGRYSGKTEFYNYDSNSTIYVYDASTLQQIVSMRTPYSMGHDPSVTNNKGMIYIYGWYNLYLCSRITGEYTQHQTTDYISSKKLYYNSKDNQLYASDIFGVRIQTFILDDKGNVTGEEMYSPGDNFYEPLYIENSSLFFVFKNSEDIWILDMNTKTLHKTSLRRGIKCLLLYNNTLYAADEHSQNIYKLTVGNFTSIETIPVRVVPKKFFVNNGYLYFYGQYQYSNTFIVDKIKL